MGEIFRRVAAIAPVRAGERGAFRAPRTMKVGELRAEAERRGAQPCTVTSSTRV
eukprot:SAG11_NODE_47_length_20431_cov_7.472752_2_plen_54_part_00